MANIIGPGGTSGKFNSKAGQSCGPMGPGGSGNDVTTKRGYDTKRTQGLRNDYQVTGNANNSKAGK